MKKTLLYGGIAVILLVFGIVAFLTLRQKAASTIAPQGNYKTIHDIVGVAFDVNTAFTSKATAVSEISEEMEISRDEYYVYKNGSSKYLLFCMNDILIAAEGGTSFNFTDKPDYASVEASGVSGVWFESNSQDLKYKKADGKTICEVNGGFCVTSEVYEDYVGKLCVMNDGTNEWSLFVGVPGKDIKYKKLDDNVKEGIEHIIDTMQYSDFVNERPEEVYEVAIGNEDTRPKEDPEESKEDEIVPDTAEVPEEAGAEEENTEDASEETEAVESEEQELSEDTESEDVEVVEIEDGSDSTDDVNGDETSEEPSGDTGEQSEDNTEETDTEADNEEPEITPEPTPAAVADAEPVEESNQRGEAVNLSNQRKLTKIDNKAYSSSIYSMLSLKDNGIITEYDIATGELVTPIISIRRVYTGKKAVDKILQYCEDSGDFNYFEPPIGCSWHVAEYYILWKGSTVKPYINIKLKGLDGEILKYKGIKYNKRTYDIFTYKEEKDDIDGNLFCFYAVPNGCRDYVLECGTGNIDQENSGCNAAYFRIKY